MNKQLHSFWSVWWKLGNGCVVLFRTLLDTWLFFDAGIKSIHISKKKFLHSVESPSMVDPQWDIWYWGSKWNLHTVCWSAVGCEWVTTSVYFGITYVCFIPSRLPVFAVEPQYLLQDFLLLSKVSFEGHIQNLQNISCWFKFWMGFVGPILIKLWTSSIWGFSLVASVMDAWELLMQTCWPPLSDHWSVQPTSPHLSGFVFYGCLKA